MITLDGKTILVADDELGFRELIGDELALAGADPITVESGDQVVPVFAKQRVDAVISDIRMPRIDGLTLLDLIKKENRKFPVFMMTGFSDALNEDIFHRGADGIYTKPCDMDEVIRDMQQALLPQDVRYLQPLTKKENATVYSTAIRNRSELQGALVNLGRGGLFLKANAPLPRVNSEIHFSIQLLGEKMEFKGVGVCKWAKVVDGVGEAFGVQLIQLDSAANALYLEFMTQAPVASIPKGPGGSK